MKPQRKKYHKFYKGIASLAAQESVAVKRKVGAVLVSTSGMIATGWNGTPAGFPSNLCETGSKTKDEVVHAERNAIDKMTLEGVSTRGSILFTTTAPCIECAKSIAAVGIIKVYFKDTYRSDDGTIFLKRMGVETERYYD